MINYIQSLKKDYDDFYTITWQSENLFKLLTIGETARETAKNYYFYTLRSDLVVFDCEEYKQKKYYELVIYYKKGDESKA